MAPVLVDVKMLMQAQVDEMVGGLMIAIASGVVLGIAVLLIIYKMIDGEIPPAPGMGSLIGIVGVLMLTVKPPHPAIPAVVLVVALTLMAFFPFALNQLDKADLLSFDVDRLEKSYQSLAARPDNFAAKLEVAKALHSQGFVHQAIAIASATLDTISSERDSVSNRSLRDQFKDEDYRVKQWMRTAGKAPLYAHHMKCPKCGHENALSSPLCEKCGNAFLLDVARKGDNKSKVVGKLVLAWGILALYIVGVAAVSVNLSGAMAVGVISVALLGLGGFFAWLFRRPSLA